MQALAEIEREIASGQMTWRTELEDIHTHIEQALIATIGGCWPEAAHRPEPQ
ncbi:MAG: hypothetical protein KatS3mg107_0326 [Gemmataceae bacterium]|nr:MAG: hypothetical protein KatS3mg107_0326 [Gemmataceae bacterium]